MYPPDGGRTKPPPALPVRLVAPRSWTSRRWTANLYEATVVTIPTIAHTATTMPARTNTRRVRRDQPAGLRRRRARRCRPVGLVAGPEDISGPAQSVDHRSPACVDLLAQVRDVELDDVGLATEVVVPDAVEDLRLAQHPAR